MSCSASRHLDNTHFLVSSECVKSFVVEGSAKATIARWGPLNSIIYTGHEDGTLAMYDPTTGSKLKSVKEHSGTIQDIQFSPIDRSYFITASKDFTSSIFDSKTLKILKTFRTERPINSAAISPIRWHVKQKEKK